MSRAARADEPGGVSQRTHGSATRIAVNRSETVNTFTPSMEGSLSLPCAGTIAVVNPSLEASMRRRARPVHARTSPVRPISPIAMSEGRAAFP